MNNNLILCVVVSYNPDISIKKCIKAIYNQVDEIVIVDNGSSKNSDIINLFNNDPKINVIFNDKNLGIACALNKGVKYALKNKYKWILTMDQDSEATTDMINKMLSSYNKLSQQYKGKTKANLLSKPTFSFDSNGKLKNCISKDPSISEIFIVEGDSAGGNAGTGRDRMYQAILPIRGKILNIEKATIDRVLANAEIKTMIHAFGSGFSEGYGNDFDISKLRYHKIIIMADADVDGAHISTLLLTLFYRFMPELIYEGHVYVAMPPLYKVMPSKGEEEYLYDDKALEHYRKSHKNTKFSLQRYKGLGEMDASQLWETTLNPKTRLLKQIEIEDARLASDVTETLMGSDVPPRREFIYEHARDAELDI